jgi:hypothetical protein
MCLLEPSAPAVPGSGALCYKPGMKCGWWWVLAVCCVAVCGCSSFNREYRQALTQPVPREAISGPWQGRWLSHYNGHNDELRALVTRIDASHYDVKFRAKYKKGITFHFGYTVRLETLPATNGVVVFRGAENLGALAGGVYRYEGHATPTNFFSTYRSKHDHGIFEMQRPTAAESKEAGARRLQSRPMLWKMRGAAVIGSRQ